MEPRREIGIVGLGRMGGGLALQALEKGIRVAGFAPGGAGRELVAAGLEDAPSLAALVRTLAPPRAVLVYVPAGAAVDEVLDGLAAAAVPGDVLVDGGNSYWRDSVRRADRLAARGLHLVDLGTSGGVDGARRGACFMAGGAAEAIARVEPIARALAVPGGFVHAGGPGAGHFTKLVHNGIEFGMLQVIGEGVALLQAYGERLPVADVLGAWRHGSVIRSWLVDLVARHFAEHGGLDQVPPYVEDTGEVNWLVADALRLEVPVPVIAQSVMQLVASRDGEKVWARAIAVMRHGFGGHPYGPDERIARERREGRLEDGGAPGATRP